MSHGAVLEEQQRRLLSPDCFARAVTRVAVAQILSDGLGLRGAHASVIEALSDAAVKYILYLGISAKSAANSSGRTESNIFDLIRSLEDLSPPAGSILGIAAFVRRAEGIPFAHSIPRFPIAGRPPRRPRGAPPAPPPGGHIPPWLSPFPEPHTYSYSRGSVEDAAAEWEVNRQEQAWQRRRAEKSLLSLERRLAGGASAEDSSAVSLKPVIEAVKAAGGGVGDGAAGRGRRPGPVRVRLGFDKRTLSPVVPLVPAGGGGGDLWVAREEERNEKKRRAEAILREAMQNPHRLVRL